MKALADRYTDLELEEKSKAAQLLQVSRESLSHKMYQLNGFGESTPPLNRQLIVYY